MDSTAKVFSSIGKPRAQGKLWSGTTGPERVSDLIQGRLVTPELGLLCRRTQPPIPTYKEEVKAF